MSQDDNQEGAPAPTPESVEQDLVKNLKAEVNRKLSNTETAMQELIRNQQILMQQLASAKSAPAKEDESDSFDPYDPKSIVKAVENIVDRKTNAVESRVREDQRKQQTLNELVSEYPELKDNGSELAQLAISNFGALDDNMKQSAAGYKLAVREAAAQLGLLPSSRRKSQSSQNSDGFTMGSGGGGTNRSTPKSKEDISEQTKNAAAALGVDLSDKKVAERVKKFAARKNWSKYSDG